MFRFNYENDFFSATDYYFTQGVRMEFSFPFVRKIPVTKVLLHLRGGRDEAVGFSFNQQCFTPTSIRVDQILYGDRPFAGAIFLGFHRVSTDSLKSERLSTELDLGGEGPCAKCKETQENIHRWLNNVTPHGWQFQQGNAPVLQYGMKFEKGLMALRYMDLEGYGLLNAGSLYDNGGLGLGLRAGIMESLFTRPQRSKKFRAWFFGRAELRGIAYDATLQGGFFGSESPYVIEAKNIERILVRADYGVIIQYRSIRLEYTKTQISPEFRGGLDHGWGLAGIGVLF